MRNLDPVEQAMVGGGGSDEEDAKDRALEVCNTNNFPDDTKVTISVHESGSLGISTTSWSQTSGMSIETTCGELRDAEEAEKKSDGKS